MQCGNLTVPLDYTKKNNDMLQLRVYRAQAPKACHNKGSIMLNFGGPRSSGIEGMSAIKDDSPPDSRTIYLHFCKKPSPTPLLSPFPSFPAVVSLLTTALFPRLLSVTLQRLRLGRNSPSALLH